MIPQTDKLDNHGEAGFSVVEVMLAAAVLLIVTIGMLPLFTRAIDNNVQGQQLTLAVNRAKSEMETMIQSDFNSVDLTIQPGDTLADGTDGREVIEYWSTELDNWVDESLFPSTEEKNYIRTTRIRQYNLQELTEKDATKDWVALAGGTPDNEVHLKEIEVVVGTVNAANIFGASRELTLRTFKSF